MYIIISHMVWLILAIALIFEQCVKFDNPISTLWLVIKKIFACSWFTLAHHARAVMQFTQLQWCIMGIKIVSFENKEIVHHHINYHWRWEEAHKQKEVKITSLVFHVQPYVGLWLMRFAAPLFVITWLFSTALKNMRLSQMYSRGSHNRM